MVIADNCAVFVNEVFGNPEAYSGNHLASAAVYFAIQLYCDFSGYSDIAIGTARLFGFNLMQNFSFPYFSTSMSELWRKWHISLSTWTNDYIFLPLMLKIGDKGRLGSVFSLMVTFTILGFWHGANWTFIAFGLLHGTVVSFEYYFQRNLRIFNRKFSNKLLTNFGGWFITMTLWLVGCIFFRAVSIESAWDYIIQMTTNLELAIPPLYRRLVYLSVIFLFIVEWLQQGKSHALEEIKLPAPARYLLYYALILTIIINYGKEQSFVYFQF